jgi:hypothetical protein
LPRHHLHRTHLVLLPPLSSPPWTTASRPSRNRQRRRWIGYVVICLAIAILFTHMLTVVYTVRTF